MLSCAWHALLPRVSHCMAGPCPPLSEASLLTGFLEAWSQMKVPILTLPWIQMMTCNSPKTTAHSTTGLTTMGWQDWKTENLCTCGHGPVGGWSNPKSWLRIGLPIVALPCGHTICRACAVAKHRSKTLRRRTWCEHAGVRPLDCPRFREMHPGAEFWKLLASSIHP